MLNPESRAAPPRGVYPTRYCYLAGYRNQTTLCTTAPSDMFEYSRPRELSARMPQAGVCSMQQHLAEHDGLIARLVMRGIDQRQAPFSRERSQLCHELPLLRKLRPIAATKLLPTLRVVSEPLAQLSARGDLLHPLSDVGIGLRHAARPQSVDEDPGAIARPGRLVSPLDTHSRSCFGLAHRYLQGGRASS